ncbi:MAG: hypothetical protein PHW68_04690, partial [Candidatus Omnitrophica bacterium]|nr:hypothetical protein [Candidatus Omnitrophota bacterium]
MRKRNVFPSEICLVIVPLVILIISTYYIGMSCSDKIIILSCAIFLLLSYMLKIFLSENGYIEKLWNNHVLPRNKNRLSIAVLVMFLDVSHVFIVLITLFLYSSIFLYMFELGKAGKNWWPDAIYLTILSAGIGRANILTPSANSGHLIYFFNFL